MGSRSRSRSRNRNSNNSRWVVSKQRSYWHEIPFFGALGWIRLTWVEVTQMRWEDIGLEWTDRQTDK